MSVGPRAAPAAATAARRGDRHRGQLRAQSARSAVSFDRRHGRADGPPLHAQRKLLSIAAASTGDRVHEREPEGRHDDPAPASDFIRQIVIGDLKSGKHTSVCTRFRPNRTVTCTSARKSICLNFGIAREFAASVTRFDDTNPVKEDVEYVDSIQEDVRWLGFDWPTRCSTPPTTSTGCTSTLSS